MDKIMFLAILAGAMTLYITQRVSVIITALMTIVALALTGLLSMESAFAGFSSPATISIGAMFVLSAGLIKTGALELLTRKMAAWSKGNYFRVMLFMILIIPISSAFINNTPVVVMMVPVLLGLGRQFHIAPSKLLMPLSYLAILGGTCTLIGTSTNLLVNEIYFEETGRSLGIFDFTLLGCLLLLTGAVYILVLGRKLLPERASLSSILPKERRSSYVTEMVITPDSPLIGKTAREVFSPASPLRFLQLFRDEDYHMAGDMEGLLLQEGDALILEGSPHELRKLLDTYGLELGSVLKDAKRVPMRTFSLNMFEVMILPEATCIGSRVKQLNLNRRFGVNVLAIQRSGRHHRRDLREMRLKSGDLLLVQGDLKSMRALKEEVDFLVVEELRDFPRRSKAVKALLIMLAVVSCTSLTNIPLVICAVAGVIAMVLTRCLKTEDVVAALDFNVLCLLIGTIPLGTAFVKTGLTEDLAVAMLTLVGDHPSLIIGAIYLVTNILTSLLSNTAVAVLMTPFVLGLAVQLGVDPRPLVMAVAFAASASFATPISYQTNIIVMGPAGYSFGDYLRFGLPLSLILWLIGSTFITLLWPLTPI